MKVKIAAIICAAGSSRRFCGSRSGDAAGGKKEYACMIPPRNDDAGKPLTVLGASAEAFAGCPDIGPLVIAVPPGDKDAAAKAEASLPGHLLDQGRIFFTSGGMSRRESVHKALLFLKTFDINYVLIHDGARPWVSKALIERVIEAMIQHKAAIPVVPALETPKLLGTGDWGLGIRDQGSGIRENVKICFIKDHLKRSELGFAQTPQGFAFPEILAAHEKASLREKEETCEYTDDAEIWGEFAGPVAAVAGEKENKKITFPEDLSFEERANRKGSATDMRSASL